MINQKEFEEIGSLILSDPTKALPKMIKYKSQIQKEVLAITSQQELHDVYANRINEGLIRKLITLVSQKYKITPDCISLYCAAMAVGTIIKEYEWGNQYLTNEGLYNLATRIYNA